MQPKSSPRYHFSNKIKINYKMNYQLFDNGDREIVVVLLLLYEIATVCAMKI